MEGNSSGRSEGLPVLVGLRRVEGRNGPAETDATDGGGGGGGITEERENE